MPDHPSVITIIGGGFSGCMVAVHLLKKAVNSRKIILIERQNSWGKGLAYQTKSDEHLLNVPAGKISAFADVPQKVTRLLVIYLTRNNSPYIAGELQVIRKINRGLMLLLIPPINKLSKCESS
jgi:uncharacterized NAD(P)/FAD-binding protein YdhS